MVLLRWAEYILIIEYYMICATWCYYITYNFIREVSEKNCVGPGPDLIGPRLYRPAGLIGWGYLPQRYLVRIPFCGRRVQLDRLEDTLCTYQQAPQIYLVSNIQ